jgi:hypothetical protein
MPVTGKALKGNQAQILNYPRSCKSQLAQPVVISETCSHCPAEGGTGRHQKWESQKTCQKSNLFNAFGRKAEDWLRVPGFPFLYSALFYFLAAGIRKIILTCRIPRKFY